MKLLVDAMPIRSPYTGLSTYLRSLFGVWHEVAPDDTIVMAVTRSVPAEFVNALPGVDFKYLGHGRGRPLKQLLALPRLASRVDADAIFCSTPVAPFMSNVPMVAVVHDLRDLDIPTDFSAAKRLYRRWWYQRSLRRVAVVIAVSQFTAERLRFHYPDLRSVCVIPHGGDHVTVRKHAISDERRLIAVAGRNNKRAVLVLDVAQRLKQLSPPFRWRLNLVGVGASERDMMQALAAERDVADDAVIVGPLASDDFWALFASSDLLLFTSSYEGFGLPVLEALSMGVPVVAAGGSSVTEASGGFAVEAGDDPAVLARHCHRLLGDSEEWQAVSEAGLVYARSQTWRLAAERTRDAVMRCKTLGAVADS